MKKFYAGAFIFVGLCVIVGGLFAANDTYNIMENWVEVQGIVVTAKAVESDDSYHVEVTYKYEFGGKTYESTPSPGGRRSGIGAEAAKTREAASYVVGSTQKLSVNPSNPHQVSHALDYDFETFGGALFLFGMGLVFVVIGIWLWNTRLTFVEFKGGPP